VKESQQHFKKYLRFSTIGLEMGFAVIIGLLVGQALDKWLGTEPWLLLVFTLMGVFAGFRSLYRLLMDLQADEAKEAQDNDEEGQS